MQPLSIGVAVNINAERFLALTAMLAAPLITALGCDDGNDSTSSSGDPTGDSAGTDDTAGDSATEDASDTAASDSDASDSAASDTAASDSAADGTGAADTGAMGSQAIDCTCAADCDGTAVGTPWQVCGTDPAATSADGQAACEAGLGAMCETFSCSECSCVTAETASVTCE